MSAEHTCPAAGELRQLLDDDLSPAAEAHLLNHLDGCPRCREQVDSWAGEPAWLTARLASLRDTRPPLETALLDSLSRLAAPAAASASQAAPAGDADLATRFQAPASGGEGLGRLGRYQLLEILGRGGMGLVYRARDPQRTEFVAVKVMRPIVAGHADARRRFFREARAAAAIHHPHVVAIYTVEEEQGLPFLVMEYIVGWSLAEHLRRHGPFSVPEVVRLGSQIAAGLAAAHAQGVVHRDVKPANILLQHGTGQIKLTDFGLARVADELQLTRTGTLLGTPEFMSPEQARGLRVDHRSDLFSLGCVLYALACGASPFQARTQLEAVRRVRDAQPDSLEQLQPEVPAWLAATISRLLAKQPDERQQSAAEIAEILGNVK